MQLFFNPWLVLMFECIYRQHRANICNLAFVFLSCVYSPKGFYGVVPLCNPYCPCIGNARVMSGLIVCIKACLG